MREFSTVLIILWAVFMIYGIAMVVDFVEKLFAPIEPEDHKRPTKEEEQQEHDRKWNEKHGWDEHG